MKVKNNFLIILFIAFLGALFFSITMLHKNPFLNKIDNHSITELEKFQNLDLINGDDYCINIMPDNVKIIDNNNEVSPPKNILPPQRIEFLNDSWEDIFFNDIKIIIKRLGWLPLRETGVSDGDLEVRIWIEGESFQGLRIYRNNEKWAGFYLSNKGYFVEPHDDTEEFWEKATQKNLFEIKPRSNWEELWDKINKMEILTLPDFQTFPNHKNYRGGICYIVEIKDGEHYRTYSYNNPQYQEYSEAKQMMEIIKTLRDEFQDSLPVRMYWGDLE